MDTNLPTPDDTSRAEDHADPGRERGPGFFDLGCLSNLAVLVAVFLCGGLGGCRGFGFGGVAGGGGGGGPGTRPAGMEGGLNAVGLLLIGFFFLPILPIIVWIVGAAAYKAYKHRPFMDEGPKTRTRFLILAAIAILATLFTLGGAGQAYGISGGSNVFDILKFLFLAALVISYPISRVYRLFVARGKSHP